MADNVITVSGNLTRDPELRFTQTGQARTVCAIAVNRRWKNRHTDDWEEHVSFFDVICWSQLGENAAETLKKGMRVIVSGRLESRTWEDDNGQQRHKVDIVADDIAPSLRWAVAEVTKIAAASDAG